MADEKISKKQAHDRITEWLKTGQPDEFLETHLFDKAKLNKSGRKNNNVKKVWFIEFKWNSLDDYKKYSKNFWFGVETYETKWQSRKRCSKYKTAKDAINRYRQMRGGPREMFDDLSGRTFRLRNIHTGQIIDLPQR